MSNSTKPCHIIPIHELFGMSQGFSTTMSNYAKPKMQNSHPKAYNLNLRIQPLIYKYVVIKLINCFKSCISVDSRVSKPSGHCDLVPPLNRNQIWLTRFRLFQQVWMCEWRWVCGIQFCDCPLKVQSVWTIVFRWLIIGPYVVAKSF